MTDAEEKKGVMEVEKLMDKLKDVKGRKERRRLLAAFNKK